MIGGSVDARDFATQLLPHQVEFAATVLSPASGRVVILRAGVGLGKGVALVALAARMLEQQPAARILFLVPAARRSQFHAMFDSAGIAALTVDRYEFRDLLIERSGPSVWHPGIVMILSADFAKQVDVLHSLTAVRWDLVVADEAQWFRGARGDALQTVGEYAARVVLASANLSNREDFDVFPEAETTVIEWHLDRLVDHAGIPLVAAAFSARVREVPYLLGPTELSLLDAVRELGAVLAIGDARYKRIAQWLRATARSSPAAIEAALYRLEEQIVTGGAVDAAPDLLEEDVAAVEPNVPLELPSIEEPLMEWLNVALKAIEEISLDSKLNAFTSLLSEIRSTSSESGRMCVVTGHPSTCYYLAAELESRGVPCQLLHGAMSGADRQCSVEAFRRGEGILVVHAAVMNEGFHLEETSELVLYDIAQSERAIQRIVARAGLFRRSSDLCVTVFVPSNDPDDFISKRVGRVYEVLSDLTSVSQPTA